MAFKKFLVDFAFTFVICFAVSVAVTSIWNVVFHGHGTPDWKTSFQLAIILGIAIPWTRLRTSVETPA
jgi:Mn2+/Fe2+ NRAMP family transporter